jgi:cation diffusion facilitator CzcD-associated flavoprotein CzcO
MTIDHVDVLIVGAGLSGVGAARHLQTRCPDRSYAILEGRGSIGGTWDLFRYPGIRSDSDMYTLGYSFKPWVQPKSIADGPSILDYVRQTAKENGIERNIRFNHQVNNAAWSSAEARWTVQAERDVDGVKEPFTISCDFLFMCAGYYSYAEGFTPDFPGIQRYRGRIVHPQKWTDDIVYAGKRVVVIGSGATAITLVPELAKQAAHVTMLQRSPTYVVSRPAEDAVANHLRRFLPSMLAYNITRWIQVLLGMYIFRLCRRNPAKAKRLILERIRMALGPDYDVQKHFTPHYMPWDQRLCLVPDGDLFEAIKTRRVSVVTDHILSFIETGIELESGETLEADLIVTATGLNLQVLGGVRLSVDGESVDLSKTLGYKGLMFSGVPNLASAFGYTNAAWTLKCDLICKYVCRLLNYMKKHRISSCTPRNPDASIAARPWVDFSSGYFARSLHLFPKQGSRAPWKLYQNYLNDILLLRLGKVNDGVLRFA